jgi:glyoxylase-like metal-dependent hydrolase (beta-lactamase superfamily II)
MRLVAPNAGPLTFKGTNTYLVGKRRLAVVDPGPEDASHLAAILAAAAGRPITHIIATHAHRDHVDGIPALAMATGARTYAYRRSHIPEGGGGDPDAEYVGHHAPDHLCLALEGSSVAFSGDHVMAWNTSVVAPPEGRMSDYLRSLELLLGRSDKLLLPGHGGPIDEPRRTVKAYLLHRKWREQAILDAVRKGTNTVRALLPVIYRDLDKSVVGAATLSLRAHIDHLAERGLIACDDSSNVDCVAVPL